MHIPMVVRERSVRVYASIPSSQADALKALAAASGVPLARAVHYAVERLLDVAKREGAPAVTGALAPARQGDTGADSVSEIAEALDLRAPDAEPEPPESVGHNGEPVLDSPAEEGAERHAEQPDDRGGDQGGDLESDQGTDLPAASAAAPSGDATPAPVG